MTTFAKAIVPLAEKINDAATSEREQKVLKQTISDILKKAGDLHPSGCSQAAFDAYIATGAAGDIRDRTWHQQHSFDPGRHIFIREHCETVRSLRNMCIADTTLDGILCVLVEKIRIVWVLKEEDRLLTQNGHRTQRHNWRAAYNDAGIVVIPPESGWSGCTD